MRDRSINPDAIKRSSVLLDILIPFLLYFAMNSHIQYLSWLLVGIVVFIRILLVIFCK